MSLLDRIQTPEMIKSLSLDELAQLAGELRQRIVMAVSANGGHLASNLGVVELTLALHYVYDFGPYPAGPDRLLFDVGHQCYSHKLLTGRAGDFAQLRKKGHVGGFPLPDESPYDLFAVGHAGTAISTAVGMARGDETLGRKNRVVALVGDASIVNGLSFEGLNNAGTLKRQLLVILNDNGMSISQPQGALAHYLERVRVSSTYDEAKKIAQTIVGKLPQTVGNTIEQVWQFTRETLKHSVWPGQIFETLGMKYMGPINGHDLPALIEQLSEIKDHDHPVLLHVRTIKGCGYEHAANEPTRFHSPASFKEINNDTEDCNCRIEIKSSARNWTTAFAQACIDLARKNDKIVALNAGMPDGTGLSKFEKIFPDRYYDTGICESHMVAMAAGMAKAGLRPVVAVYSTFVQRAFDQIWQEVVLNHQPVIFALDRAGYVGDDGAVHHGFCDLSFLRAMPEMVLMAPSDEAELNRCLALAASLDTASSLRYPRDAVPATNFEDRIEDAALRASAARPWVLGQSRTLRTGEDATIIAYGAMLTNAFEAAELLQQNDGLNVGIIDARFCKPVDGAMLGRVLLAGHAVLTVEDHALTNGFGSAVLEYAQAHRLPTQHITRLGMPDRLVQHATRAQQLAEVGLDALGIARSLRDAIRVVKVSAASQPKVASVFTV